MAVDDCFLGWNLWEQLVSMLSMMFELSPHSRLRYENVKHGGQAILTKEFKKLLRFREHPLFSFDTAQSCKFASEAKAITLDGVGNCTPEASINQTIVGELMRFSIRKG